MEGEAGASGDPPPRPRAPKPVEKMSPTSIVAQPLLLPSSGLSSGGNQGDRYFRIRNQGNPNPIRSQAMLQWLAIVSEETCEPKKYRQECKKSCPVVNSEMPI